MRMRILVALIATVALGGATFALADSSEHRTQSTPSAESKPVPKRLDKVNRLLGRARAARVSCRSMSCINRTLTRLTNDVRALKRDAFQCEQLTNVTRYSGYVYTPDGGNTLFETTALDHTDPGDTPTDRVVVYVC